ncbi:N-acetylmuramoyl-L-alanine amidase [Timonella sp. A28]|uniref:N-acetylmuramoyl-L-alanine amidase n=1 Tax=Timonella sp. A28 TaxID=3442640 RepID=UPI003EB6C1FF
MLVKQQFAPRTATSRGTNTRKFITVHDTGNKARGADAQAHATLQERGNSRAASWHWQVDEKAAIQSFSHKTICWHSGHWRGNRQSIGVEICVNADGNHKNAVRNAVKLVARIMREEKIPLSRVVQHHYWTGKNCPASLRQDGGWEKFLRAVEAELAGVTQTKDDTPKPAPLPVSPKPVKTTQQLAQEVLAGKHGTGVARKRSLGSRFAAVQAAVNRLLSGKTKKPKTKSVSRMAIEVIQGKHGTGHAARQKSLKINSATYAKVRAEVNRRVR